MVRLYNWQNRYILKFRMSSALRIFLKRSMENDYLKMCLKITISNISTLKLFQIDTWGWLH